MRKAIIASIAAIMFFIATPAVAFAHGGGNSGHGSGHDDRRFDRKFDDRDHFKRFPQRNFFNDTRIITRIKVVNKVINSRNVRIDNAISVNNTVNR